MCVCVCVCVCVCGDHEGHSETRAGETVTQMELSFTGVSEVYVMWLMPVTSHSLTALTEIQLQFRASKCNVQLNVTYHFFVIICEMY